MRDVILQLFLNKQQVVSEISTLQTKPTAEWDEKLIKAKHEEWDRYEHLIDLFFKSVGI